MIERLIISTVILLSLSSLWLGWNWYKARLVRSIKPVKNETGKPTLLWFTAEYCAPCKLQQGPIMARLAEKIGQVATIQQIDVAQNPDLAKQYKVMTLPTTVVLDHAGQVAHINYGVTDQARLEAQLL